MQPGCYKRVNREQIELIDIVSQVNHFDSQLDSKTNVDSKADCGSVTSFYLNNRMQTQRVRQNKQSYDKAV